MHVTAPDPPLAPQLVRARMHRLKPREAAAILGALVAMCARRGRPPDPRELHLLVDELARWSTNKMTNARWVRGGRGGARPGLATGQAAGARRRLTVPPLRPSRALAAMNAAAPWCGAPPGCRQAGRA